MLRLERKYLVPNYAMDDLRNRILPFVRPDIFGKTSQNGVAPEYVVRSIYFDSINLDTYLEKKEGVLFRKKFRLRGYGNYSENKEVVFEIKKKIENRIKKHRAFSSFSNIGKLLETGNLEKYIYNNNGSTSSLDDAKRFFFHIKKNHFAPTCKVVYEREAYHGKFDADVRITFDKNIRSQNYPVVQNLFENDKLAYLFKEHFILEIKYFSHTMPVWAKSIIQEFKLRHEALSKYVIGFDAAKENTMGRILN